MPSPRTTILGLLVCLAVAVATSSARADVIFTVNVNTGPLVPLQGTVGPFSLQFQLVQPGTATNNTIVLSQFNFGGGGGTGSPTIVDNANGNLTLSNPTVTLMEPTFPDILSSFTQGFTPGSHLSFVVDSTTDVDPSNLQSLQDNFQFFILDGNGNALMTTDPTGANSLVNLVIDSSHPTPMAFSTNDPRLGGNQLTASVTVSPVVASPAVPEPASLGLLLVGLGGLAARRLWRR